MSGHRPPLVIPANVVPPFSNSDISTTAAIARSKLDFGSGLVNADIAAAAAIARSKLDFGSGLVNADIAPAASIVYTKLNLATSLTAADHAAGVLGTIHRARYSADGVALGKAFAVSTTQYGSVLNDSSPGVSEAVTQGRIAVATTVRSCVIWVSANGLTAGCTVTLRKNGGATAMAVTVGAAATGAQTLTGGPVAFAAGDTISLQIVTVAGGTSITIDGAELKLDNY